MVVKSKPQSGEPKRANRTIGLGEAIAGALDPVLKKRGFASRDIVAHWRAMAPTPYDRVTMPDKLNWPRGERSAGGATLYLRCVPGHQLALAHEGPRIAAAINRYFGYVLVEQIRVATMPFIPGSTKKVEAQPVADPVRVAAIGEAVDGVADERLRQALTELGLGIAKQRR
jgi:hypothetical protein